MTECTAMQNNVRGCILFLAGTWRYIEQLLNRSRAPATDCVISAARCAAWVSTTLQTCVFVDQARGYRRKTFGSSRSKRTVARIDIMSASMFFIG